MITVDEVHRILSSLNRLEQQMDQVQTAIQNLTAVVSDLKADIATVLTMLQGIDADHLTDDNQAALEGAISKLQDMDTNVKAAATPPAPAPAPADDAV